MGFRSYLWRCVGLDSIPKLAHPEAQAAHRGVPALGASHLAARVQELLPLPPSLHLPRQPGESSPVTTEGSSWGHPRCGLGAIGAVLEPFCGHLSPKIDKVSCKSTFEIPPRRTLGGLYPCSLLPAPYSLFSPPYSFLPTPYSLLPTPYSLLPAPYSLLSTPYTLHPTP